MWKNTQRSWVGGQLDPELAGRQDLSRYFQGASEILNFTVRRQGLLSKRGGTTLVGGVDWLLGAPEKVVAARIVPFCAERSYGYYLLLVAGDYGTKRAYIFNASQGFACCYPITDTDPPEGLSIPYEGGDFYELEFTQTGDTIIVTHPSYRPARFTRIENSITFGYLPIGTRTTLKPQITAASALSVSGGTEKTAALTTVKYVATAVIDGVEGDASSSKAVNYYPPWKDGGTVQLTVSKGENDATPDYYNIYKSTRGAEYGYIGSTSGRSQKVVSASAVSITRSECRFLCQKGCGSSTSTRNLWYRESLSSYSGYSAKSSATWTNGWASVVGSDRLTATMDTAVTLRRVVVSLGCVRFLSAVETASGSGSWRASLQFIPFLGDTITVSVNDGEQTVTATVPESAKTERFKTFRIMSAAEPTNATLLEYANKYYKAFAASTKVTLNLSASVAATKVELIGGSGDITAEESSEYGRISVLDGEPVVISGATFYATDGKETFVDDYITPDLTTTLYDRNPKRFVMVNEHPTACALYQQRLCLAGTNNDPARIWLSATGNLWEFDVHKSVREDDALDAELAATEFPRINHLLYFRDLLAFTDGGEWVIAPVSGNAISYKTFSAKQQSAIGCAMGVPPILVGAEALFVKAGGQTMLATRYNYSTDGYEATDLTVLSQRIFKNNRIVQTAYRPEPDSWIYCVLEDGTVATLVYMKEQEVCAWTRMALGGGWLARGVASSRALSNGTSEMVWLVQKGEDGEFELWRADDDVPFGDAPKIEDHLHLDRKRVLAAGESAAEGETVVYVGEEEGSYDDDLNLVKGGARRIAGIPFEARMTTMRPEPQGANATIQFEVRNAKDAEVRVLDSGTFTIRAIGVPESLAVDAGIETKVAEDGTVGLATADVRKVLAGRSGTDGRVEIKSTTPWPLNVLSLSVDYEIQTLSGSEG